MENAAPSAIDTAPTRPLGHRLLSLDALRGFIMFWIVGGEDIVHALHKVSESGWSGFLARQMDHKEWEGVAFYDLIFPSFVFIIGVSLVFSLSRTIAESGRDGSLTSSRYSSSQKDGPASLALFGAVTGSTDLPGDFRPTS